jgi:hypothetical protein
MITIPIDRNIIDHCKAILRTTNFGQRGKADGNKVEQYIGIIGQSVIMDLLGMPLIESKEGFDGGIDFTYNNKTYDIKTMGRETYPQDHYVNNLIAMQSDYNVDRYIFASINKLTIELTICGWIDKQGFKDKAIFYPEGATRTRSDGTTFTTKAGLYEIKNSDLIRSNSLDKFINQLND